MPRMASGLALTLALALALPAADWPQWRGSNRDGISKDTGLLQEWPAGGPKLHWKATDVGTGYSAPAVVGGKVYVQTTKAEDEFALCLDEKTGKEVWRAPIGKVGKNKGPQYPGTRATPTVDGDRLYCLASAGQLACLTTDGKVQWTKDLAKDFKGSVGNWAYAESVLVDGDRVVCTPGGPEATLAALDKKTGETVWKCAVPGGDAADYASIMALEAGGGRQYVQFTRKGLVACDAKTGKFLWRYDGTLDPGANMITPVVHDGKVYISSRSGGGAVEVKADGGKVTAKQIYLEKALTGGLGGAVLVDGHLYGGTATGMFCAEFATGKVKWTEQPPGNVSVCYADGRVYARSHRNGDVILIEPNPKEFVEKGRLTQPERSKVPAWPHPVVANGGLYLRDMDVLLCYDVKK